MQIKRSIFFREGKLVYFKMRLDKRKFVGIFSEAGFFVETLYFQYLAQDMGSKVTTRSAGVKDAEEDHLHSTPLRPETGKTICLIFNNFENTEGICTCG